MASAAQSLGDTRGQFAVSESLELGEAPNTAAANAIQQQDGPADAALDNQPSFAFEPLVQDPNSASSARTSAAGEMLDGSTSITTAASFQQIEVSNGSPATYIDSDAVADAPPPTAPPSGRYGDWILALLLLIMLRALYKKHKAVVLKVLACLLNAVAIIGPLKTPATIMLEHIQTGKRSNDEPDVESGLVAASLQDELEDEVGDVATLHRPRKKKLPQGGGEVYAATGFMRDRSTEDAEEVKPRRRSRKDRFEEEREPEIVEEGSEVDDEAEAIQPDNNHPDDEDFRRRGCETNAATTVKSSFDHLEAKLAQGKTLTLKDIADARAGVQDAGDASSTRVTSSGEFVALQAGARLQHRSHDNDDSFTMVGLPTQIEKKAQKTAQDELKADRDKAHDERQNKLEDILREKNKRLAQQVTEENERLMRDARRKLRPELLHMDNEIDTMLMQPSQGGGHAQMQAAKWLLEHAYTKYPPPSFSKRRASQETLAVQDLRFRDSIIQALKVLQARYAPAKNQAADYGAERAVIAEEITKHAFSLAAGVNRSSKSDSMPSASGLMPIALLEPQEDDGISFPLTDRAEVVEDVEDAD